MESNLERGPLLEITTLGGFDIKVEGKSFFEDSGRAYKMLELFKYFLTFRGKRILPETIIEDLYPDNEFQDPRNVLRTQIFRLRQNLKKLSLTGNESDYFSVVFSNGYYIFELGKLTVLDIEEFEKLCMQGNKIKDTDPDEAARLYKKAIKLYAGGYLSESNGNLWAVPIRNHYQRIYLQTLYRLLEILKDKEDYSQMVDVCEHAITIEPYEEALHIYFLEALLKQGQIKYAMSHYEYSTNLLFRELGVKPSAAMRNIYRKIQSYNDEKGQVNLEYIQERLESDQAEGALLCDMDYFKFLYNIRKRNSLRAEIPDIVSLISLAVRYQEGITDARIKEASQALRETLRVSLRKGDAYSFWNDTQVVVMLAAARSDKLDVIETRIKKKFKEIYKGSNVTLSMLFSPIISDNAFVRGDAAAY